MSKQVRVRFAPSPTGPYILAEFVPPYSLFVCQENNGVFTIEDTDQNRFVPGAETYIIALEWLGIPPDETIGKNEKFGPIDKAKENLYIKTTLIN
jgi:glutamyl-tRNA synthetase